MVIISSNALLISLLNYYLFHRNFAKVNVSFQKALKTPPVTDAHYTTLPLISHFFPPAKTPPPSFVDFYEVL